jgi:DNA-binding NarL/FixJ family response regulator
VKPPNSAYDIRAGEVRISRTKTRIDLPELLVDSAEKGYNGLVATQTITALLPTFGSAGQGLSADECVFVLTSLEFSPQQARSVKLLLQDKADKQIAREMGLRVPTVRTYLSRIFQRTGCTDRVGRVLKVFQVARQLREKNEGHQE